ncbi:MAG: hypothetical protein K1X65_09595 [Caldilineales bacterium]|nr:hypothetical protein [Caldilineales bacterium]MCW5860621.1 hypothetical protein [Caldilineales bacterium]
MDSRPTPTTPETIEEAEPYFPAELPVQLDDADSIARYPARVVRDAIDRQERLWSRDALLKESEAGQD